MARLMLSDELWSKLRGIMLQHRIYDKRGLRLVVEAMLYRMRVGCPWRDLPAEFGCWNSVYQQFNRWSLKDKLMKIFKDLVHSIPQFLIPNPDPFGLRRRLRRLEAYAPRLRDRANALPQPERIEIKWKTAESSVQDPDLEWEFIDGSIVRAHQHSSGGVGDENQAIGKSVGGNTTKIHMAVDAFGVPIEFLVQRQI